MDLLKVLQDMIANIQALQTALADAEVAVAVEKQKSYDEGFAAGVASVPVDDGATPFSQADLDAAVSAAVEPLNAQIADLSAQLQAAQNGLPAQIADAVAALKMDLLAKYEAQQVAESHSETGFKDLLK